MKEKRSVFAIRLHAVIRLLVVRHLSKDNIIISEYPKSGGSWLASMLNHCLKEYDFPRNQGLGRVSHNILHGHYNFFNQHGNFILVVRDGRDVMISAYYHFLFSNSRNHPDLALKYRNKIGIKDVHDIKKNLPLFIEFMSRHRSSLLGHKTWSEMAGIFSDNSDNICLVRYEDMLKNPHKELERIFCYLGKSVEHKILEDAVRKYSFQSLTDRNPGVEDISSFVRKGIAGDWKNHFSKDSVEVFKKHNGDALVALGYEESNDWKSCL